LVGDGWERKGEADVGVVIDLVCFMRNASFFVFLFIWFLVCVCFVRMGTCLFLSFLNFGVCLCCGWMGLIEFDCGLSFGDGRDDGYFG